MCARILSEINFMMLQDKTDLSKKIEELTALRKSISLRMVTEILTYPRQISDALDAKLI